jgi:hypothetical protein
MLLELTSELIFNLPLGSHYSIITTCRTSNQSSTHQPTSPSSSTCLVNAQDPLPPAGLRSPPRSKPPLLPRPLKHVLTLPPPLLQRTHMHHQLLRLRPLHPKGLVCSARWPVLLRKSSDPMSAMIRSLWTNITRSCKCTKDIC